MRKPDGHADEGKNKWNIFKMEFNKGRVESGKAFRYLTTEYVK
jgi:hypothetical protein